MFKYLKTLFKRDEKGQGMVEYGLILALVSIVAIGSLTGIGGKVSDAFDKITGDLSGEVVEEVVETEVIPFETIERDDPDMPYGETSVETEGVNGETKVTYAVTYEGGVEVSREEISREVMSDPVNEVILVGSKRNKDYKWVLTSWGGYSATNEVGEGYYKYVGSEKEVVIPHEINGHPMTSYFRMFNDTAVEKVVSSNDKVTDMGWMFLKSKASDLDVSGLVTSSVINMRGMFEDSTATNLDLGNFYTSSVTNMSRMFYGSRATSLNGLGGFDTSSVTNMSRMFNGSQAASLDLSSFNTSSVINMSDMFNDSQATSINGLNNFDTSSVTNMSFMFCRSSATSLDLSSFDTSSVTNMSSMFHWSRATNLDISSFDTSSVTNMSYMFRYSKATSLDLSNFDTRSVTDMEYMFDNSSTTELNMSNFNTVNVTIMANMFRSSSATSIVFGNNWNTGKVTDMSNMFHFSSATNLDLSSFDTSSVTDMSNMFYGSYATSLDLSSFDTSKVGVAPDVWGDYGSFDNMFNSSSAKIGYARTQTDANNFNSSSNKPSGLTFTVK